MVPLGRSRQSFCFKNQMGYFPYSLHLLSCHSRFPGLFGPVAILPLFSPHPPRRNHGDNSDAFLFAGSFVDHQLSPRCSIRVQRHIPERKCHTSVSDGVVGIGGCWDSCLFLLHPSLFKLASDRYHRGHSLVDGIPVFTQKEPDLLFSFYPPLFGRFLGI